MMSPWKRREWRDRCTINGREGRNRDGIWVRKVAEEAEARSECTEVGLELRLYWFCWLCLSPPQRTQLAYDVWLLHPLPLQQGTRVRESGTTGTLLYAAATAGPGRPREPRTSQFHWEWRWTSESERDTHLLVDLRGTPLRAELDKSPVLIARQLTT